MPVIILGCPNIAGRASMFVQTAGTEPFGNESTYLKNDEPSQTARITIRDPLVSTWRFDVYGETFAFDGIALVNHNLSDNGYFRVVNNRPGSPTVGAISPSGIVSSTNINAGAVYTDVAGSISSSVGGGSSSFIGPNTTTSNWDFVLDFNSTSVVVKRGTAMAQVVILASTFGGVPTNVYPTIAVDLMESGSTIRAMGRKAVTRTDQVFVYAFNPNELVAPDFLANVRTKIYGYPGDNGSYFKVNVVAINYEGTWVADVDSLWISANQAQFASIRDGILPTRSIHYLHPTTVNLSNISVLLMDDGTELNPPVGTFYGAQYNLSAQKAALSLLPGNYLEAGMSMFGPKVSIDPGFIIGDSQPKEGIQSVSASVSSLAGQAFNADSYRIRTLPASLELLCTRDVKMDLMFKIGWQKGSEGVIYVILDSDLDLKYQTFSAFPCICTGIQSYPIDLGRTGGSNRGNDMYYVKIDLAEKQ